TIENLAMDGGVQTGCTYNGSWPASTNNGDGWDVTHDAIFYLLPTPMPSLITLKNCWIHNWRGEQVKSSVPATNSYEVITNCTISDGDATALNDNVISHT